MQEIVIGEPFTRDEGYFVIVGGSNLVTTCIVLCVLLPALSKTCAVTVWSPSDSAGSLYKTCACTPSTILVV